MFVYILYIYLKVFKWLKQISGSDIRELRGRIVVEEVVQ